MPTTFMYGTYQISVQSYRLADGRWMPEARVHRSTRVEERVTPVRGPAGSACATEEEANTEAIRLAMAWVDAQ